MYHHHTSRSSTNQYNASRLLAPQPPCIHSLQSSILTFCTLHPFLPCTGGRWCMGNSLACRMFSYSCTVWVSLPYLLLGLYSSQNRSQSFSSLPSNTLLILVTLIIRSRSFLPLVRHTIFPLRILHTFGLLPLVPSNLESTRHPPSFS